MQVFFSVIAAILEIAGVGTIGYAFYRAGASGTEIYAGSLQDRQSLRIRNFELDLDPSMSPVGFSYTAYVDRFWLPHRKEKQKVRYLATLSLQGKEVARHGVEFLLEEESGKKLPLLRETASSDFELTVPSAGRYSIATVPGLATDNRVMQELSVTVTRNVKGPNWKQLGWGAGMIVLGGILQLMFGAPIPGARND